MARVLRDHPPLVPNDALRTHAGELLRHLEGEAGARFVLRDNETNEEIELSEALYDLLRHVLVDLSQNRAVQILPRDVELTTVQAAEFLQVSRPFVIKLIDEGELPCRRVGSHRRIRLADLMAYRRRLAAESKRLRESMTKEAEKLGWGY